MRALSMRQPYAELILRGIKTVEYGSTELAEVRSLAWDLNALVCVGEYRIVGERFYILRGQGKKPEAGSQKLGI